MIHYTYTASGQKLSQQLEEEGRSGTLRRYAGPFVVENGELKWINTPEGRIVQHKNFGITWVPEFHLKDHLGNTRVALLNFINDAYFPTQTSHYYPFGMRITGLSEGSSNNRYLYNDKEFQDDFDLNWYDYGARFYDPEIARWHVIDAMAEYYYNQSPYNYVGNDPINFIDPDGNFRTRFGAWLYKLVHGGSVEQCSITGEYYVGQHVEYEGEGDGVAFQRRFDWRGRNTGKERYDRGYGIPMRGIGGFEPETQSENVGLSIDPGLLSGRVSAGRYSSPGGPGISIAFLISRTTDIFKTVKESDNTKELDNTEVSLSRTSTAVNPPDDSGSRGQAIFRRGGYRTYDPKTGIHGHVNLRSREDSVEGREGKRGSRQIWWHEQDNKPDNVP